MTRYAALLRGIAPSNPSMHNDKLRDVFEGRGFERVSSVLASGNLVFSSAETDVRALEDTIQQALRSDLGIAGGTIIRAESELRALLDSDPFPGLTHGRGTYLTATFVKERGRPPAHLTEKLGAGVVVVGHDRAADAVLAVVDNSDAGATPDFMRWLEKSYGSEITTRTWLTVQRIVTRLES